MQFSGTAEQGQVHPQILPEIDSIIIQLISAKIWGGAICMLFSDNVLNRTLLSFQGLYYSATITRDVVMFLKPGGQAVMLWA